MFKLPSFSAPQKDDTHCKWSLFHMLASSILCFWSLPKVSEEMFSQLPLSLSPCGVIKLEHLQEGQLILMFLPAACYTWMRAVNLLSVFVYMHTEYAFACVYIYCSVCHQHMLIIVGMLTSMLPLLMRKLSQDTDFLMGRQTQIHFVSLHVLWQWHH